MVVNRDTIATKMAFTTISENSRGNKGVGCTIAFSVGPFERYYAIFSYYCNKQWNGLFLYMMAEHNS